MRNNDRGIEVGVVAKWFAILLLVFNGAGALFGGWSLMRCPDGSGLKLPLHFLSGSPFVDYFIPGLILFLVNGVYNIGVIVVLLRKLPRAAYYLAGAGLLLVGWIVVQIIIVRTYATLHTIFLTVGALQLLCGFLIIRSQRAFKR